MSVSQQLLDLAPSDLVVRRKDRFDGGGYSVPLNRFVPEDVSRILQTYNTVKRIYDLWLYMRETPNYRLLREAILRVGDNDFLTMVQSIGVHTYQAGENDPLIHKVVHDIHGGSLVGLTGYAALLQQNPDKALYIRKSVFLARDHAKMMRNAVENLDPDVRAADESIKIHSITDYIDKLDDIRFHMASKQVEIELDCQFHGNISNRCLETSAIDRILYNFINNAARFAHDDKVVVTIFPINEQIVRWVISNRISEEHKEWLAENAPAANMKELFQRGVTRGGRGLGLSTCADFISSCFGVHPPEKAVEDGYLGMQIVDDHIHAWFHWPMFLPH